MSEVDLSKEIEAFLRQRAVLQREHASQWVVFADERYQGAFDQYEGAVRFAIERFRDTPFLVRNVDAENESVPLILAEAE
jgi:hypothetical protein